MGGSLVGFKNDPPLDNEVHGGGHPLTNDITDGTGDESAGPGVKQKVVH